MFHVRCEPEGPRPVVLRFRHRDRIVLSTDWTAEDAELMAYALLKAVEQARAHRLKDLPPAPPLLPPAPTGYTGPTEA
jgi:hypothetical protein